MGVIRDERPSETIGLCLGDDITQAFNKIIPVLIIREYSPLLEIIWCKAPGASMRAFRGIHLLYHRILNYKSYNFMGVPNSPFYTKFFELISSKLHEPYGGLLDVPKPTSWPWYPFFNNKFRVRNPNLSFSGLCRQGFFYSNVNISPTCFGMQSSGGAIFYEKQAHGLEWLKYVAEIADK